VDAWALTEVPESDPGATWRARWTGSYGGAANQELGSIHVSKEVDGRYLLTAAFPGIGSPPVMFKLFSNGVELAGSSNPASEVTAARWPIAFRARTGSLSIAALFDPDTPIQLNSIPYLADEIRFLAEPSGRLEYISGLEITGAGLPSFTVPDAQGEPLRPRLDIALADNQVVLSWDLPGYQLQSTTALTEPVSNTIWNNVAGGPPLTLPRDDPRKFFRLVSLAP
jgi:hypothetical protein